MVDLTLGKPIVGAQFKGMALSNSLQSTKSQLSQSSLSVIPQSANDERSFPLSTKCVAANDYKNETDGEKSLFKPFNC